MIPLAQFKTSTGSIWLNMLNITAIEPITASDGTQSSVVRTVGGEWYSVTTPAQQIVEALLGQQRRIQPANAIIQG